MKTVYLISCVAEKRALECPAESLYCSDLFRKARAYVLRKMDPGDKWYILSAKHGLLHPQTIVGPYNETLNTMCKPDRLEWARRVTSELRSSLDPDDVVVFLAGQRYREFLEPSVLALGCRVSVPMRRMRIGEQLHWLGGGGMSPDRDADLRRFYQILAQLEERTGGTRKLSFCSARSVWPKQGVYFFFEQGEARSGSGTGLRVVRVGTHAVASGSKATLWSRLRTHRGTTNLGGNHRGSVFRLLVGSALAAKDPGLAVPTWGVKPVRPEARRTEKELEGNVSRYIGTMPLLWVPVEDPPSSLSRRAYIERNSIALLSNALVPQYARLDPPSPHWLGQRCPHPDVSRSGLWNSDHVNYAYDPLFLDELEKYVHA
jgi:hypothetical protein